MNVRITEEIATVVEVSYDVDVSPEVFAESHGESVEDYRDRWVEVHHETIRSHAEVTGIEEIG